MSARVWCVGRAPHVGGAGCRGRRVGRAAHAGSRPAGTFPPRAAQACAPLPARATKRSAQQQPLAGAPPQRHDVTPARARRCHASARRAQRHAWTLARSVAVHMRALFAAALHMHCAAEATAAAAAVRHSARRLPARLCCSVCLRLCFPAPAKLACWARLLGLFALACSARLRALACSARLRLLGLPCACTHPRRSPLLSACARVLAPVPAHMWTSSSCTPSSSSSCRALLVRARLCDSFSAIIASASLTALYVPEMVTSRSFMSGSILERSEILIVTRALCWMSVKVWPFRPRIAPTSSSAR
mmetsp:Transcript_32735/g.97612  ORF Transcript_32735/g.97612 Transcript_32735/m.97612 type:complete len:303 (+) Transcript_32735:660-1568(+)